MIDFGSIVLVRFPFTDRSADKLRPALVVSHGFRRHRNAILCYITSRYQSVPLRMQLDPSPTNRLRMTSWVRFDLIETIDESLIAGRIGTLEESILREGSEKFYSVFGFYRMS